MKKIPGYVLAATAAVTLSGTAMAETVITAVNLAAAPAIDGSAGDWANVPSTDVPLTGKGGVDSVSVSSGINGDMIYFLVVWKDETNNSLHKPYVWDADQNKYKRSRDKEDRLAFAFPIEGDFSNNHVGGNIFKNDVWHWKASRSNPVGLAHDKSHVTSDTEFKKAKDFKHDGGVIYQARPSDSGDKLYTAAKPTEKTDAIVPSYNVNSAPKGSIADIQARGTWSDGVWTLEMARKLDTGNADDAVIPTSGSIQMAIAAFNDVDGKKHSVSEVLTLQLP